MRRKIENNYSAASQTKKRPLGRLAAEFRTNELEAPLGAWALSVNNKSFRIGF